MIIFSLFLLAFPAVVAAQSIMCVAGQCLQGVINTTLGATLTIPSSPSILLLPGQYTSSSQPRLLNDALSSKQASLSLPSAFSKSNSSTSSSTLFLPLTVSLQPGVLSYPQAVYRGQPTFTQLPQGLTLTPTTLFPGSFLVSSNTWVALTFSNKRIIVWDAIPDFSQLPFASTGGTLSVTDIQSTACSSPCASIGTCLTSGQCKCPPNFAGQSCESCASGFFGPSCQPCTSGCATCDEGLTGSGKCFVPTVSNPPSSCNCVNGVCGFNGCKCNAGWINHSNGTACASCAPGFYLTSNGDCSACELGCTQCSDGSGDCTVCNSGFTQDSGNPRKCSPPNHQCIGTFFNGSQCTACSTNCRSCIGPGPNDCTACNSGQYMLNGRCVSTDANGVCSGTTLIANDFTNACDGCPAKCTACSIPNFKPITFQFHQAQCTGCIPGFVLFQGQCLAKCPFGTFLASDNLTCTPCDSSCSTCVGDAKFCLSCNSNLLAINGTCTTACPPNTFSSGGSCLSCHPDCGTCTGSDFNECFTCPSSRPVLSSHPDFTIGRCLPTCSRSEFLDPTSLGCKSCDGSCASCIGPGPNACMACGSANQVLKSGTCVASNCTSSSSIVPGLGVCLSDLVSTSSSPVPSKTATAATAGRVGQVLTWWNILLMTLGCISILALILWLWRRYARKQRAQKTFLFADTSRNCLERGGVSLRSSTTSNTFIHNTPSDRLPEALPETRSDAEMSAFGHPRPKSFLMPMYVGGRKNLNL